MTHTINLHDIKISRMQELVSLLGTMVNEGDLPSKSAGMIADEMSKELVKIRLYLYGLKQIELLDES